MSQLLFAVVVGLIFWLRHLMLAARSGDDDGYVLYRIYTVYTCFLLCTASLFNDFRLVKVEKTHHGPQILAR